MTEKKKTRKLEPKFGLDMEFAEALERFAQTDPKEVAESVKRSKRKRPPGNGPPRRPARKKCGKALSERNGNEGHA